MTTTSGQMTGNLNNLVDATKDLFKVERIFEFVVGSAVTAGSIWILDKTIGHKLGPRMYEGMKLTAGAGIAYWSSSAIAWS